MKHLFLHQSVVLTEPNGNVPAGTMGEIIRGKEECFLVHFAFGFPHFQNYRSVETMLEVYDRKKFLSRQFH